MPASHTIVIHIRKPSLRQRLRWYTTQARLRALEPFAKPLTADEWYAADCPPYVGQKAPWKL